MRRSAPSLGALCLVAVLSSCSPTKDTSHGAAPVRPSAGPTPSSAAPTAAPSSPPSAKPSLPSLRPLPGMPAVLDANDAWAADRPNALSPAVENTVPRVYVPNTFSNSVTVIDPKTYKVLRTVKVGREPQHVVPSWDLRTLWVNNDLGNSLTPINAATGVFGRPVRVRDPYNLYFTPDGAYAIVMASLDRQLVFRDAHTMAVRKTVPVPCAGVNHADFSSDGRYFLVSCEFSGQILKVDTIAQKVVGVMRLPRIKGKAAPKPQDVKMSPDGKVFFVADMMSDGLWFVDGKRFIVTGFLHTGKGAHGLYVSRDSTTLLVTNRDEGSISTVGFATRRVLHTWRLPGGGSPDMGGLSADGKVFWVSGRYNGVVYAISARDGKLLHRIRVGAGPHGLCIWPQPGRYSLGHTGVMR